ncbi:DUF2934 domain-containing protein [Stutzerimonas balearica]|uniref:DUF2934 domain-containing protein n=1 Tax=Stutzerimonas balearica TaxID=74829 RepID=UPI003786FC88
MTSEEQRIREFAYQIWQSEGCPHGQDERHWEMARKLVEAERTPAGAVAKPATSRTRKPAAAKPAEPGASASASKPRAKRSTKATAAAPKGDTDAQAGAPEKIKKPRATRGKAQS